MSCQRESQYNAILDPAKFTIGVDLGLVCEKSKNANHMRNAMLLNEDLKIEQIMFEVKLEPTDRETENGAMGQQIGREPFVPQRQKRFRNCSAYGERILFLNLQRNVTDFGADCSTQTDRFLSIPFVLTFRVFLAGRFCFRAISVFSSCFFSL